MTEIVRAIAETPPDCTEVVDMLAVFMVVLEIPSVCTGVLETPPDFNRLTGTWSMSQKKQSDILTTSEKETHEAVGSNLAGPFYTSS